MEYATEKELEKLEYHKNEIVKIKKSSEYRKLLTSQKTPTNLKLLERYKLNITKHTSNIEMVKSDIHNRRPRRNRKETPKYNNYPKNPAKEKALLIKPKSKDNRNPHKIINTGKIEKISFNPLVTDEDISFIL